MALKIETVGKDNVMLKLLLIVLLTFAVIDPKLLLNVLEALCSSDSEADWDLETLTSNESDTERVPLLMLLVFVTEASSAVCDSVTVAPLSVMVGVLLSDGSLDNVSDTVLVMVIDLVTLSVNVSVTSRVNVTVILFVSTVECVASCVAEGFTLKVSVFLLTVGLSDGSALYEYDGDWLPLLFESEKELLDVKDSDSDIVIVSVGVDDTLGVGFDRLARVNEMDAVGVCERYVPLASWLSELVTDFDQVDSNESETEGDALSVLLADSDSLAEPEGVLDEVTSNEYENVDDGDAVKVGSSVTVSDEFCVTDSGVRDTVGVLERVCSSDNDLKLSDGERDADIEVVNDKEPFVRL